MADEGMEKMGLEGEREGGNGLKLSKLFRPRAGSMASYLIVSVHQ